MNPDRTGEDPGDAGELNLTALVLSDADFLRYLLTVVKVKERHLRKWLLRSNRPFGSMSRVDFARWLLDEHFRPTRRQRDQLADLRAVVGILSNSPGIGPGMIKRFLSRRYLFLDYQRPLELIGRGKSALVFDEAMFLSQLTRHLFGNMPPNIPDTPTAES